MSTIRRMLAAAAILSAIAAAWLTQAAVAQTPPIVKTQSGDLQGAADLGIFAFKGIPYAAPPVGRLRWREPEPAARWQGIRKADEYGNACIQTPGLSTAHGGDPGPLSEDCLYLNVWTPKPERSAGLPVMMWIHGGAFIFGAGGLPVYDGSALAKKGVIVVTINYRLGQLGFFAHPALEKENPGGPANFALLDQIAALKWIKANIAEFGGDPGNVTILGQSAGAKSVLALYASPLARGLFQKGIAQSPYMIPDATRAKALEVGGNVATALGLKGAAATAAELRALPAEKFGKLTGRGLSTSPVLISGDTVLPRSIQSVFADGGEAPLPLILGNTSDDASVALVMGIDPAQVLKRLRGAGFLMKILYPRVKDETEIARQAARDLVFTLPVRWIADRHSKRAPTWRYYFDYTAVKNRSKFLNGVPHGAEIPYFLDTGDIFADTKSIFTAQDREFSRQASDYWIAFARTGSPAAKERWPSHRSKRDRTMIFDTTIALKKNFMRPRLNIFMGLVRIIGALLR